MPLNLYTSNRMEVLVDTLAAVLRKPLASAFTQRGDSGAEPGDAAVALHGTEVIVQTLRDAQQYIPLIVVI